MFPGPLATNYWKGHYYGLPLDTNTRIWVYNPAALTAAGASGPPRRSPSSSRWRHRRRRKGYDLFAESGYELLEHLPMDLVERGQRHRTRPTPRQPGILNGPKSVAAVQMLVDLYKAGEMPG